MTSIIYFFMEPLYIYAVLQISYSHVPNQWDSQVDAVLVIKSVMVFT